MKYQVEINVMPLKALLDPQGKAVASSMKNIGITTIQPTHTRAIGFPWDKKPYRRRAKNNNHN